jgi:nucleobase:cation symporter-1, NCS1 family
MAETAKPPKTETAKTDQPAQTIGTVEQRSYDYVPLSERHGKPRHLFSVWFGENIHILAVVTGSLGVVLGLGLMWTIIAILVGNVVGALFMAFHSAQGPKLGLPQMIQSRAQFGYHGGLLPTVIALFMYLVYGAAGIVPCGQALQSVFGGSLDLWIVLCTIPMVGLAIFGYNQVHKAMRIQTAAFVVLFLIIGIWLLVHGIPARNLHAGHFVWGPFLGAVSAYAVWQISYAPYVSDYSRYLPPDQTKNAFAYTYSGSIVGSIFPMAIGAGLAALYPTLSTVGAIHKLVGGVLTFLIGISIIMPNSFNVYGGIITTLTIGTNFKAFRSTAQLRIVTGLIIGVLMLLAAIIGAGNFINNIYNFLLILLYFLIPWTAVNLTDFYLVRRGQYRTEDFFEKTGPYGLWNWTGLGVYIITFLIEIPFMSTPHFTGPIAHALNGGDITWIVGTVVAVPLYYFLERARLRRERVLS